MTDTNAPQPEPATKFIAVNADEPGDRGIYGYADFPEEVLAKASRELAKLEHPPRLAALPVSPALAAYLDEYGINFDQDCWIRRGDLVDLSPTAEGPLPRTLEEARVRLQRFLQLASDDLAKVSPVEGNYTASIEFRRRGPFYFFVRADVDFAELDPDLAAEPAN